MNPTSDTPTDELRNVELKFSRFGIRRNGDTPGPRSIFWLATAVLTYVSPARGKQRVELPELGFLTTAQKKKVRLHLCPSLFLVQSPAGDYHFYNTRGEHLGSVPADDAGTFDTFAVDAVLPPLRFIGATFRKGNEMRLFSPQGELMSTYPATEED